ncbi:MAG: extracellular solute-binding protein [Bifidobacteriaceae bacterium]|jgi:raffinose/stachyose/melibiose transport system substrate-binding protein|nr:extracellular solute-binding protein [Bifidobacteriaceae bacterium]
MMNRPKTSRFIALAAASALTLGLAACGQDGGDEGGDWGDGNASGKVTLTWWHNGTAEPSLSYYQSVADAFTADHPDVTIEVTPIQNEDLQTKIIAALQGGDAPDIFAQWGGQEGTDQFNAGQVLDITQSSAAAIEAMGAAVDGWTTPEGNVYGLPFTMGIGGVYYNVDLFQQAGISQPPSTMEELADAVGKLKAIGVAPVALGGVDEWPAAHGWYWLSLRECTKDPRDHAAVTKDFSDECFVKAGEDLAAFAATSPFQEGFMSASAQQGAQSSAGLLANGQAAMELMGVWEPAVLKGLTDSGELDFELGWFSFPAVAGGKGDPKAAMGGGDGFSCWSKTEAPEVCSEFLSFIVNVDNQVAFAQTGIGVPVTPGGEAGLADEVLKTVAENTAAAPYVELWLDKLFGNNVGGALNTAVTEMLGGANTPAGIVQSLKDAAELE